MEVVETILFVFLQICIAFALVAVLVQADDEPFSIGLGVLSPSYSQTVGKENVKVNFQQKDNGFSYSVGDPNSGTNTYLNFGSAATGVNPGGFANADPSPYSGQSGYVAPQPGPSYNGYAGYQAPSYGAGASSGGAASGYGSGNSFGGSSGFSGYQNQQAAAPVAPNNYFSETARKPDEASAQILPAGFSYHGTEGQAFLRKGDSPNFIISDEPQESERGPAENSFFDNFGAGGAESSDKVLPNGLVGYGSSGTRGSIPVGGKAGPQFAGFFKEHGGHSR